jgi:hypothetical protein
VPGTAGRAAPMARRILTCNDQLGATSPPGNGDLQVDGLALEGLRVAASKRFSSLPVMANGHQRFRFLKAVLYIRPQAPPEQTLTVSAPAGSRLYYTDADTWASRPTAAQVLAGSRRTITVQRCPGHLAGYAGGLLLKAAGCVTLHFQGGSQENGVTVTVAVGIRHCKNPDHE